MREILFRGKRIDNGEWVYGSFVMDVIELHQRENFPNSPVLVDGFIRRYDFENKKIKMYEVDRESVGQYIGLTDKNGTKIFDGDIVRHLNDCPYADESIVEKGIVFWNNKSCGWYRTSNGAFNHGRKDIYRMSPDCFYEVIGNIYENAELLGGADNGNAT